MKSVVMIYSRRDADGFGKGRPTVRTSESFFFKLYYMHKHCFILEMSVQYFKSPDDIATKKYG